MFSVEPNGFIALRAVSSLLVVARGAVCAVVSWRNILIVVYVMIHKGVELEVGSSYIKGHALDCPVAETNEATRQVLPSWQRVVPKSRGFD